MSGLIADIGGTNVRFALVGGDGTIHSVKLLRCADFLTLVDACNAYLREAAPAIRPTHAALAVASPVSGDHIQMTNHIWAFSIAETRRQLALVTLDVINDFIAVVLGLPHLTAAEVRRIGNGEPDPRAPIVALGAGTGLGMAALVRTATGAPMPLSSEGGHVTLAAFNDREAAVLAELRREFNHVSAERVLSGPGIVNLYRAIAQVDGATVEPNITPAECTARALRGSCPVSAETLDMFCTMLGTVAADLALTLNARGGVYIAGGVVPGLGEGFAAERFRQRFEDKGRFGLYLAAIPTWVVTRPLPAFAGLAALVAGH